MIWITLYNLNLITIDQNLIESLRYFKRDLISKIII